jgi:hypothetical protein
MAIRRISVSVLLLSSMPFSFRSPLDLDTTPSITHLPYPQRSPKTTLYYRTFSEATSTPTTSDPVSTESKLSFTSLATLTSITTTSSIPFATELSKAGRTIYFMTSVSGCNIEGTAPPHLKNPTLGTGPTTDILSCQGSCRFTTACFTYSFNTTSSNCTFYNGGIDGEVKEEKGTGVFFSTGYPSDGSHYCYDDVPLPPASSS